QPRLLSWAVWYSGWWFPGSDWPEVKLLPPSGEERKEEGWEDRRVPGCGDQFNFAGVGIEQEPCLESRYMTLYGAELKIDGSFGVCSELYFRFANALEKSPWTINLSKLDRGGIGSAYGCATIGYQFDVIGGMKTNAWPNREHALYLHALLRSLLEEDYVAAILKAEGVEVVTLAVN